MEMKLHSEFLQFATNCRDIDALECLCVRKQIAPSLRLIGHKAQVMGGLDSAKQTGRKVLLGLLLIGVESEVVESYPDH
jgi:hypothetical protein